MSVVVGVGLAAASRPSAQPSCSRTRGAFLLPLFLLQVVLLQLLLLRPTATHGFVVVAPVQQRHTVSDNTVRRMSSEESQQTSTSTISIANTNAIVESESERIVDRSTLILLEHINLNIPSHYPYGVPFYFDLLGCGLDPRKAENLQLNNNKKKTLWANCGASQFHLPYGTTAQRIPGVIGLRFTAGTVWNDFVERCRRTTTLNSSHDNETHSPPKQALVVVQSVEEGVDESTGRPFVRLVDYYGNNFLCRPQEDTDPTTNISTTSSARATHWKQPIVAPMDTETWGADLCHQFGRNTTDCAGIDFVEFWCPVGTARKIALFYESVLDATTSVVPIPTTTTTTTTTSTSDAPLEAAIIAIGHVRANGRADQSLVFRETTDTAQLPSTYDGHHIALYVGESMADFEQAYRNAALAGVVWVNPRFSDDANTLDKARQWQQFRFKNMVDLETGETVFELEHELRSCHHTAWPGRPTTPAE